MGRGPPAGPEITLEDYDIKIKELKKEALMARNMPDQLAKQKEIRSIESERQKAWQYYDSAYKEIERQKDTFLEEIAGNLGQKTFLNLLFQINWQIA